ncbi:ERMES complex subunit mmm1 [Borealophlyctis nickersoniae]|nr:ERMES complex subunit mmm1 [Borealophlyctis nickersoniae]
MGPSQTGNSTLPAIEEAVAHGTAQFIKGFIAGQVSLGLLVFFLVKVFLFKNGTETRAELAKKLRARRLYEPKLRPQVPRHATESHVLAKTCYDVHSHPIETCDWLNVLLAQAITKYRCDPGFNNRIITLLDDVLNGHTRPGFLVANAHLIRQGPISITEFSLGDEFPIIRTACMRFAEQTANLRAEIVFEFDDQITIGIDTQVLVNWPKPCIAALPVSLSLSVVKFSGTLALEFVTHPDSPETYVSVSILEDFLLDFEVRSLLGHRTKVKDLPKLASMITSKLRSVFVDELVWPSFKKWPVPMLWGDAREEVVKEELEELVEELKHA